MAVVYLLKVSSVFLWRMRRMLLHLHQKGEKTTTKQKQHLTFGCKSDTRLQILAGLIENKWRICLFCFYFSLSIKATGWHFYNYLENH